jgi:hypothetical protein
MDGVTVIFPVQRRLDYRSTEGARGNLVIAREEIKAGDREPRWKRMRDRDAVERNTLV